MKIELKKIEENDCLYIWELRNHLLVRKNSFNKDEIPYEKHKEWFANTLKNSNRKIYIGLENGKEIGDIRFDKEEDKATVSIIINPEIWGKGYGTGLLKSGTKRYLNEEKNVGSVIAEVFKENIAAKKIFKKAGYSQIIEDSNKIKFIFRKENMHQLNKEIQIGNKKIGENHPVFIIAELSGNHNQSYDKAVRLVKAACEAGVDAIKVQTYTPDTLTINSDKKWFQVEVNEAWKNRTLYNLYELAHMPWEWQPKLAEIAKTYNVPLFSTAYDETAVDFLEKMNVPLYKVASFEIGDLELLKKIASTQKPVIISKGMASLEEIELAYKTLKENGSPEIAILHCVSSYPALPEEMNLSIIPDLKNKFDAVIGLSDHTLSTEVSVASVAFGAKIIEKHFTLDRNDGGVDSAFSLEPKELKELIKQVRNVEKAIGSPNYAIGKKESENMVFKRSLFVIKDIKAGEQFTTENIKCIRPGYGLAPKFLSTILGKTAKIDIEKATPLAWDLIEQTPTSF